MKLTFEKVTNTAAKGGLLNLWIKENPTDPLDGMHRIDYFHFYYAYDGKKNLVGYTVYSSFPQPALVVTFVNKKFRGKGVMHDMIVQFTNQFNINALVMPEYNPKTDQALIAKYLQRYAAMGFPNHSVTVDIRDNVITGEYATRGDFPFYGMCQVMKSYEDHYGAK